MGLTKQACLLSHSGVSQVICLLTTPHLQGYGGFAVILALKSILHKTVWSAMRPAGHLPKLTGRGPA